MTALMGVEDGEDDGFVVEELIIPGVLLLGTLVAIVLLEEEEDNDSLEVKLKVPGPVLLINAGSGWRGSKTGPLFG